MNLSRSLVLSIECSDFRCGSHMGDPKEWIPILKIDLFSGLSFKKNLPSLILFLMDFRSSLYAGFENNTQNLEQKYGIQAEARPRHIIVAFRDNQIKHSIYAKKKMLKGSQIVMKEDLTVERMKIVKEASEKYGFKNVWTFNGNIFVKTDNKVEKYLYNITDH
nr:unnamed protein product [Callosobruchus chinensis]